MWIRLSPSYKLKYSNKFLAVIWTPRLLSVPMEIIKFEPLPSGCWTLSNCLSLTSNQDAGKSPLCSDRLMSVFLIPVFVTILRCYFLDCHASFSTPIYYLAETSSRDFIACFRDYFVKLLSAVSFRIFRLKTAIRR